MILYSLKITLNARIVKEYSNSLVLLLSIDISVINYNQLFLLQFPKLICQMTKMKKTMKFDLDYASKDAHRIYLQVGESL
jgi:hypothetical protein